MSRLITAKEIYQAKKEERPIYIDENTIITPLAKDLAKENNIFFKRCDSCKEEKMSETKLRECVLSEDEVYNILKIGIENNFFTENDLENLLSEKNE